MVTYVSLLTVGLVLFERRIVYSALIPATLYLVSCGYLSFFGQLTYAPLFLLTDFPYKNGFWVLSMLFFIVPILLSQWRYREALIAHLSQVDPLTNTFNRRSINQCLEQLNRKQASSYAVILVDLDHFKQINDEHGHHKGDEALVQVCHVLAGHIREQDVLGRFGGEEFILVLKQATAHQAKQVAERCRQAITQIELYDEHNQPIHFTASFGIALSHHNTPYEKLLSQADQAKAYGRNQVVLYQPLEPAAS
nr:MULTISPECIES: GGDEF domain-containing protein [unclassified Acinetobacter]